MKLLVQGAWQVVPMAAPTQLAAQPEVWLVMSVVASGALLQVFGAAVQLPVTFHLPPAMQLAV